MYDYALCDLDRTLHFDRTFGEFMRDRTRSWFASELDLGPDRCDRLLAELRERHPNPFQAIRDVGLSVERYQSRVFRSEEYADRIAPDRELRSLLAEIDAEVVVVSHSPRDHCRAVLGGLGIADQVAAVRTVADDSPTATKGPIFEEYPSDDAVVLGDDPHNDLEPAERLGLDAVHVDPDCTGACDCECFASAHAALSATCGSDAG